MENFAIVGLIFTIVGLLVGVFGATMEFDKIVHDGVSILGIGALVLITFAILSFLIMVAIIIALLCEGLLIGICQTII